MMRRSTLSLRETSALPGPDQGVQCSLPQELTVDPGAPARYLLSPSHPLLHEALLCQLAACLEGVSAQVP